MFGGNERSQFVLEVPMYSALETISCWVLGGGLYILCSKLRAETERGRC
jgi:hypothetical protein